ncbi:hypothetical protein CLF_113056 [Clonorchis sinensis]|uniref:Uncharacterized protein n=1 Tax=Clonorchis sinensis TaxID=79923 RepID=G7YXI9_CLOSI|nr:hypothetical protein CLF_113056 [Clonorchis sinensis]
MAIRHRKGATAERFFTGVDQLESTVECVPPATKMAVDLRSVEYERSLKFLTFPPLDYLPPKMFFTYHPNDKVPRQEGKLSQTLFISFTASPRSSRVNVMASTGVANREEIVKLTNSFPVRTRRVTKVKSDHWQPLSVSTREAYVCQSFNKTGTLSKAIQALVTQTYTSLLVSVDGPVDVTSSEKTRGESTADQRKTWPTMSEYEPIRIDTYRSHGSLRIQRRSKRPYSRYPRVRYSTYFDMDLQLNQNGGLLRLPGLRNSSALPVILQALDYPVYPGFVCDIIVASCCLNGIPCKAIKLILKRTILNNLTVKNDFLSVIEMLIYGHLNPTKRPRAYIVFHNCRLPNSV